MSEEIFTTEQIQRIIRAARDSGWVIESTIEELAAGKSPNSERKGNIDRNVSHLKIVVGNPQISESGEDITDLHAAITTGKAKLAEDIWLADETI